MYFAESPFTRTSPSTVVVSHPLFVYAYAAEYVKSVAALSQYQGGDAA